MGRGAEGPRRREGIDEGRLNVEGRYWFRAQRKPTRGLKGLLSVICMRFVARNNVAMLLPYEPPPDRALEAARVGELTVVAAGVGARHVTPARRVGVDGPDVCGELSDVACHVPRAARRRTRGPHRVHFEAGEERMMPASSREARKLPHTRVSLGTAVPQG